MGRPRAERFVTLRISGPSRCPLEQCFVSSRKNKTRRVLRRLIKKFWSSFIRVPSRGEIVTGRVVRVWWFSAASSCCTHLASTRRSRHTHGHGECFQNIVREEDLFSAPFSPTFSFSCASTFIVIILTTRARTSEN